MKLQEVLCCKRYPEEPDRTFISVKKNEIEKFFSPSPEKKNNSFFRYFRIPSWDIGQLDRFEAPDPEDQSEDQKPDPEIFNWVEAPADEENEASAEFVLSNKGFELLQETLSGCFVPGYWTLHQLQHIPFESQNSILIFNSEDEMKRHLRAYPHTYRFCIDPSGVRREIKIRIEIDLEKD